MIVFAMVLALAAHSSDADEREMAVQSNPPALASANDERMVDMEEIIERSPSFARRVAEAIAIYPKAGFDLASEKISFSDTFGYVFRYDMVEKIDDAAHRIGVLVTWAEDRERLRVVTYPGYDLGWR